jgi:hypothetical protein
MAGFDLCALAELMGLSSFQKTMRYAQPAPEHNREAVNSIVSAAEGNRRPKRDAGGADLENEMVTKSVTSENVRYSRECKSSTHTIDKVVLRGPVAQVDRAAVS